MNREGILFVTNVSMMHFEIDLTGCMNAIDACAWRKSVKIRYEETPDCRRIFYNGSQRMDCYEYRVI